MLAILHLISSVPPRPCRNLSRPLFLYLVLDVTLARSSHQVRYNVDAATNRRFGALLSRAAGKSAQDASSSRWKAPLARASSVAVGTRPRTASTVGCDWSTDFPRVNVM